MSSKVELVTVNTPLNSSSFQQQINNNFTAIEESLNKQLQREPQEGVNNAMQQEIDMNSNRIINLAEPVNPSDAARFKEVQDVQGYAQEAKDARDEAVQAKEDAVDAKEAAEDAKTDAVDAKEDAESARDTAVQAKDDAVAAKDDITTLLTEDYPEITTVANNISDVQTVAANVTDVNTVAGVSSDVTTVAGVASDVSTVAGDTANIATVAGISSDVSTVAGVASDISTVEGIASDVSTVAGIASDVTAVAGDASNVSTVAGMSSDISDVVTNMTAIQGASQNASDAADSAELAHKWATSSTVVESGQYGASYYALRAANYMNGAESARDTARDWATKTDGLVESTDYSSKYYAQQAAAIVATLGSVLVYKGSVATYADLPATGNHIGDVWNVLADGKNYAWDGTAWDDFGGAITVSIATASDVSLTNLQNGEVLIYNSTTQKWENGTVQSGSENVLNSLTSAQAAILVANGTYEGEPAVSGTVYTNEAGKFQQYTKTTNEAGTVSVANATSVGGYLGSIGNTLFALPYSGTTGNYSTDKGATWTNFTSPVSGGYVAIGGTSEFVVAIYSGSIMSSTDGHTWTTGTKPTTATGNFTFSTANGKLYLNDREHVYYTSDGSTWTQMSDLPITGAFRFVSNDNIMVLIPDGLSSSSSTTWYKSTDNGTTWTSFTGLNLWYQSNFPACVLDTGNGFVIAGSWSGTGGSKLFSEDFTTNTTIPYTSLDASASAAGVKTANGLCVIISDAGYSSTKDTYCYSADGATWTKATLPAGVAYRGLATVGNDVLIGNQRYSGNPLYDVHGEVWYTYTLTDLSMTSAEISAAIPSGILTNTATGSNSLTILGTAATGTNDIAIGVGSKATGGSSVALGYSCTANGSSGIAIGNDAYAGGSNSIYIGYKYNSGYYAAGQYDICIGYNTSTSGSGGCVCIGGSSSAGYGGVAVGYSASANYNSRGVAIGNSAKSQASYAIQLGQGTNSNANTFSVGLSSSLNVQLLDSTGEIPEARMAKIIISGASDPTTATVGTVGQLYKNTTDGGIFKCTDTTGSVYTWSELGAGGGGSSIAKETYTNPALTASDNYCTWTITHGLNTKDVVVSVFRTDDDVEPMVNIIHRTTSTVIVVFNSSADIAAGAYKAVIIG